MSLPPQEWTKDVDHNGIRVWKNCKRSAGDTEANVDLEFNLIFAALDAGNIIYNRPPRNTITGIKIVGRVHDFTTDPSSGNHVAQQSHLTINVMPGGSTGHLWLLPTNGAAVTPETRLDTDRPFTI